MRRVFRINSKDTESYLRTVLSIIHLIILTALPVFFILSGETAKIHASFTIWGVMVFICVLSIRSRGTRIVRDALECSAYSMMLVALFYLNSQSYYIFLALILDIAYFSLVTSMMGGLTLSLFQIVYYLIAKVIYSGIDSVLIDTNMLKIFIISCVMGIFGDTLKSSFRKSRLIEESGIETVRAFVETLEAKDQYTCGHSIRVSRYSREIAKGIGLPDEEVSMIERAALLHDIGKVGISDSILNKKGVLTDREYNIIKTHPDVGVSILSNVKNVSNLLPFIRSHHERIDGKGYPDGLKGDAIPLGARIICIADAYEAMTSDRSYRKALAREEAIRRLKEGRGTQFSPELVDVFVGILDGVEYAAVSNIQTNMDIKKNAPNRFIDIFSINTLSKKVNYGLIIVGLIPILSGIFYITGLAASTVDRLDNEVRGQQLSALNTKFNDEEKKLENTLMEYANWDDTYASIDKRDAVWIDKNIFYWLKNHYSIDMVIVLDKGGAEVASYGSEDLSLDLKKHVYEMVQGNKRVTGICSIGDKPYMLSISPVLHNDGTGIPNGTILAGIRIDKSYLDRVFADFMNMNFIYGGIPVKADGSLTDTETLNKAINNIVHKGPALPVSYVMGDYAQYSLGIIPEMDIHRSLPSYLIINYTNWNFSKAQDTMRKSSMLIAILAVVLMIGLIAYMNFIISAPIKAISKDIKDAVNRLSPIKRYDRNDEIDTITEEFNRLIASARDKSKLVDRLSTRDGLTALNNHSYCLQYMDQLINSKTPFALIRMDIDKFNVYNENTGYSAGDIVLVEISDIIGKCIGKGDMAVRFDGDEFAVVTTYTSTGYINALIQTIVERVNSLDTGESRIELNTGYSIFPNDGSSTKDLVNAAKYMMI